MRHTEIAIVGGSNAGLSAALTLGRSRRSVTIIDSGEPRNAGVRHAYGLYTRDHTPPAELLRIGRKQLEPYDARFVNGRVTKITPNEQGFRLALDDGTSLTARRILLATGVADHLPDLPGLRETWGRSAFSCPYCDGWEIRDKPIAVLGNGGKGYGFSFAMHHWSPNVVLCTNGVDDLDDAQKAKLARFNIELILTPLDKLAHADGQLSAIHFTDGRVLPRQAFFTQPDCGMRSPLARQLGCAFEKDGTQIVVDKDFRTSVPNVYAAGDIATDHSHLAIAASSGMSAAMAINHDFFQEEYSD